MLTLAELMFILHVKSKYAIVKYTRFSRVKKIVPMGMTIARVCDAEHE
jgi:hypothetical protein